MSLDREYGLSQLGPTWSFTVGASSVRIRLASRGSSGQFRRRSFMVQVTTGKARMRQGGKDVVAAAPTAGDEDQPGAALIKGTVLFRVDVESDEKAYLAAIRDGSTDAVVEITLLTDTGVDDPPVVVT